jgi:hypothetical protein
MMKTKLRLVVCAILLIVSVNANATMAPVAIRLEVPTSNDDISLLISGLEALAPVTITDCRFKLLASSLELDAAALPAEIYNLIVNTINDICHDHDNEIFTASFDVAPKPAALLTLSLTTPLTKELK